jgi:hypothetical protein
MLADYDSLVNEISSLLSNCRLAAHRARLKALSTRRPKTMSRPRRLQLCLPPLQKGD